MTPAVRTDLLHLGPEALTQAANAGIVKRAMRELEGGYRPQWTLTDDGLLEATFSDGIKTTWPPATPIQHVRCSCGAASVCRHRVILALAYRASLETEAAAASPGSASDEAIARVVPATLLARAQAARETGLAIDVHRRASGEPCDTARLPAATVRFWAGDAIEAARCDCVAAAACEHVALGVWAFRAADAQDAQAPSVRVRLGQDGGRVRLDREPWHAVAEALLRHGVARGAEPVTPALSHALAAAREQRATWLVHLLQDLERWSAAYAARSALYEPEEGSRLLAELALRLHGGEQAGQAMAVLGIGQGEESELDRLRLMCLGARTTRDGEARRTRLVLADTDTGTALVLSHDWSVPAGDATKEAALRGAQKLAPGVRLEALAQGQLLARQARRRADGSLALARSRATQNSVLPQVPDWSVLGVPLRHASVAALRAQQQAHPTAALLPRHAARRFVVFTPATIEDPVYDPVTQTVAAVLRDAEDHPLLLKRTHEGHVPAAIDSLSAALAGAQGRVRHVAGLLHWAGEWPVIEAWALACDAIVVPDFAATAATASDLPLGRVPDEPVHPVARVLAQLREVLGALLHDGVAQMPAGWGPRCHDIVRGLAGQHLHALARQLDAFRQAVLAAQANPREARLGAPLLALAAVAQLHEDAVVQMALATRGDAE